MIIHLQKIKTYIDNKLSTHVHGKLQNDGTINTSDNASKNVVTDSAGKITTEAKYSHPTPNELGGAKSSNLYKITTDAQGHIIAATAVSTETITIVYGDSTPSETYNIVIV